MTTIYDNYFLALFDKGIYDKCFTKGFIEINGFPLKDCGDD